jgi:squid-like protein
MASEGQSYDDMGNGEYQQDVDEFGQEQNNGGGDASNYNSGGDTGSAEKPGRDDDRKMFVGGLSWETTDTHLREYFTKFGDIESINVKTDPNTGRSRGFAFIVFTHSESIDKIMCAGEHILNSKKVDPKRAKARTGKIFVGGLSDEISEDDVKTYFNQYGTVS